MKVSREPQKIMLLTFFTYSVFKIFTLTAEEWSFRGREMAQRTKRGSRLVPL